MCKHELQEELKALERMLKQQRQEKEATKKQLLAYQRKFSFSQRKVKTLKNILKKLNNFARALIGYPLGRRNFRRLYSRAYKRKDAANQLKPYLYRLYELGFEEKTLQELRSMLQETTDRYLRRAIAWELALWYANQRTKEDYKQAYYYITIAENGEKVHEQKQKIALLKAEACVSLDHREAGRAIIQEMIKRTKHPDFYLAMANMSENIADRFQWINQALAIYQLRPITYQQKTADTSEVTYDDIRNLPTDQSIADGPLVSIILPAYNFEAGIQIAIESILEQTWKNIELIIVDDCSTDGTVEVVKQYMKKDHRIKLFSTGENSGPYVARNIALSAAKGEFVTVNDADDWSHAEKIAIQAKHLMAHREAIANTSEHARLTDDLIFHRRGTLSSYIFSNMSSLMFRREPVLEEVGYWDTVRFAADGEFKRRLFKTFGEEKIIDLPTGPLSLPRQSIHSLTGSSAFGYQGFLMGARKEYVESFENYHREAETLYYPFSQQKRLFPVPNPMKIKQEKKPSKNRYLDIMYAVDFHADGHVQASFAKEIKVNKQLQVKAGMMQLSCYNSSEIKKLNASYRNHIDGNHVEMVVYGEDISCELLIIKNIATLQDKQKYLPTIHPKMVIIIIDQLPVTKSGKSLYTFRDCAKNVRESFGKRGKWYALSTKIQQQLTERYAHDLRFIDLATDPWIDEKDSYEQRLNEWLIIE